MVNWNNRLVEMDRKGLFAQSEETALNEFVFGQLFRYVDELVESI